MQVASKLTSIGIIALSIAIGLITFYIMTDLSKDKKKQQIEEVISNIINFIIYIWLGKIIIHFSLFIEDPLAVLAHPSTSMAFYIAVLLSAIHLFYKTFRKKINIIAFLESFMHVFLTASFIYEFIQYITGSNPYAFGYLILLSILFVAFIALQNRITTIMLLFTILTGWAFGIGVLLFIQPYVTVFSYTMSAWFVAVFYIIGFSIILIKRKWNLK